MKRKSKDRDSGGVANRAAADDDEGAGGAPGAPAATHSRSDRVCTPPQPRQLAAAAAAAAAAVPGTPGGTPAAAVAATAANSHGLRQGLCGFSDSSLARCGRFYPPHAARGSSVAKLRHYASVFSCLEIDTSAYAIPTTARVKEWTAAVPPGFLFHMKVFSLWTGRAIPTNTLPREAVALLPSDMAQRPQVALADLPAAVVAKCWQRQHAVLDVLADAGKLGVVVVQFPTGCVVVGAVVVGWVCLCLSVSLSLCLSVSLSLCLCVCHNTDCTRLTRFTPSDENKAQVVELQARLRSSTDHRVAVEFRDRRWFGADSALSGDVVDPAALHKTFSFMEQYRLCVVAADDLKVRRRGLGGGVGVCRRVEQ